MGKSELSLALARLLNAEIVSMDSMAIYRGMNIGTAKPSDNDQQFIPHHLIDIVDPHEEFSVSEYLRHAEAAAKQILSRNRTPLFVGGTGLYLRSLLRGVFEGPAADHELRQQLERERERRGNDWLHAELRAVDRTSADRLHPNDTRRIIRAIEVFRLTGTPLSSLQREAPLDPARRPAAVFWLEPPRDWLYARINLRVDKMMRDGLLEETRELLARQPTPGRTARQALGYRELICHIVEGVPLDNTIEQIKTNTRQFAKRQHTWFRNLEECAAVDVDGTEEPAAVAERLQQLAS